MLSYTYMSSLKPLNQIHTIHDNNGRVKPKDSKYELSWEQGTNTLDNLEFLAMSDTHWCD